MFMYLLLVFLGSKLARFWKNNFYLRRIVIALLAGICLYALYTFQIQQYNYYVFENGSTFQYISKTPEDALDNGILIRRFNIEPRLLKVGGIQVGLDEVWIEAETKYKFLFNEKLTGPYYLCITLKNPPDDFENHTISFYLQGNNSGFCALSPKGETNRYFMQINQNTIQGTVFVVVRKKESKIGESTFNNMEKITLTSQ